MSTAGLKLRMTGGARLGLAAIMILLLAACSDTGLGDLKSFVEETKQKKGVVEPLPEFKTAETFRYSASRLRDPFSTWKSEVKTTVATPKVIDGVRPNVNRSKEVLENFPLDTLRMIGTLEFNQQLWGLVKAPDGIIYRVKTNNYLGQNYGKIHRIQEDKLLLTEIVPNGLGGWEERQAVLSVNKVE